MNDLTNIEYLIPRSSLSPQMKEEIYKEIEAPITEERIQEILTLLYRNQLDPIRNGFNYNQGDIKRKLKHIIDENRR